MTGMDAELEEIYNQVADQVTPDDFEARVEEKVALMAGLCDQRTAAMLVARDLGALRSKPRSEASGRRWGM